MPYAFPVLLPCARAHLLAKRAGCICAAQWPEMDERPPSSPLHHLPPAHARASSFPQIHAALSELAEAQLALLAGIMPHHALQFLAMESTAAVGT